jgi:hypothetical protein
MTDTTGTGVVVETVDDDQDNGVFIVTATHDQQVFLYSTCMVQLNQIEMHGNGCAAGLFVFVVTY